MHHTKVKADIGLTKVISDITLKGYVPCIPLSEHQPYDIVVMNGNGSAFKVQVKYSRLKKNGTVDVRFRRNWADKRGTHSSAYSADEFDYYAIYCPEKDKVLYVPNSADCPKAIRFDKPANNQAKYIKWANNYLMMK
ncbi:MAG: group I intron-associated PD-(D/E)XK endonuclease [Candidatus Omnitrophota bacterium]|nr:group I intron-associated PD-(D/E)XK endonuclease [Candidatus Omnitrophota bacterium]